ncbi:MAG: hypothetical protein Q4E35_04305 [Eubacteriales bacterium]|nr:hypothetical protein [Eubacteriales bacterium]
MINGLISGLISGFFASLIFALFLLSLRPKINISEDICKDPKLDNVYRIKIVNKSKVNLNNLRYSLHYCYDAGDGILDVEKIQPRKEPLDFIDRNCSENEDYAIRLSFFIDREKYPLDKGFLKFTVLATHSFSNTSKCFKRIYTKDNIKKGVFQGGESMRIIIDKD